MLKDSTEVESAGLGARVRSARNAAGLTLEQVSRRIGVSPATLSLIERDKVSVTVDRLAAVAEALGIELEELVSPAGTSALEGGRPGGPRDPSAPATPKVLAAAIDCFMKWGYHGTSMRRIAHAANVSVAGVYHYYDSKEQMLIAILDSTMDELTAQVEAVRAELAAEDPATRFAGIVEELAYYHATSTAKAFIGASEMRSVPEPDRSRIAERRRSVQYMIDVEAHAAAEAGAFSVPNLTIACRVVANMCTSLAQWYDPAGPVAPREVARQLAQHAVAMMHTGDR